MQRSGKRANLGRMVAAGLVASSLGIGLASAKDTPAGRFAYEGEFAGTFICSRGEMGMTLSLQDAGPASEETVRNLCRSASGSCNDAKAEGLAEKRQVEGVLNFFPTSGNPDAPAGAFRVHGMVDPRISPAFEIELSPGSWIDQPVGFGASAMVATLVDGEMVGKPTAPGCHTLKLRQLRTLEGL